MYPNSATAILCLLLLEQHQCTVNIVFLKITKADREISRNIVDRQVIPIRHTKSRVVVVAFRLIPP